MNDYPQSEQDLLKRITEIAESNLTDGQFGVSELARELGMSRSNLHRKVSRAAGITVSQYISRIRLHKAMELLKSGNFKISDIAYDCGYHSVAYFTKCFREYYRYPPGEVEKTEIPDYNVPDTDQHKIPDPVSLSNLRERFDGLIKSGYIRELASGGIIIIVLLISFFIYQRIPVDFYHAESENNGFINSIAVLPFKNLNIEADYEYFSTGVLEAINRHLSQITDLKVISLTTTDQYKESGKSAKEIGNELFASHLLEGSIQRHKNLVRIEVRLIDVNTENQVWAENYDRELKDIFETQSDIAGQIVLALKSTLSPEEKIVLAQRSTENAEAYDLYLKGIYEINTLTRHGNNRAIEYFQQAIALDSNYALSYAGIAGGIISRAAVYGAEMNAPEAMALAKPYIEKALALDPELVNAHLWNGIYLLYNNWDFEGAEQAYKKSIITEDAVALANYANFLNFTRRHEEALKILQILKQKHPFFPNNPMILALYYLGRYSEAEEYAESRLRLFKTYATLECYGFLKLNTGHYDEAIQNFQQIFEIENVRYPRILGWMGAAYARGGQSAKALDFIKELKGILVKSNAGSPAFFIAVIYAALGDEKNAITFLHKAVEDREMEVPWLISEPQFLSLHNNKDFKGLIQKVGFKRPS
jgi:TolB-like protein/AraC-like DNA-binding protein